MREVERAFVAPPHNSAFLIDGQKYPTWLCSKVGNDGSNEAKAIYGAPQELVKVADWRGFGPSLQPERHVVE